MKLLTITSVLREISMFARIFLVLYITPATSDHLEDDLNSKESSQVEVRAVFINCQIVENQRSYGSESSRFQREELFKHNALRDCTKKLALTVKMTTESGLSSSDEYIPIEHVFDGSNQKRVRLLNPYILRLRREPPLEAYKLHKLDTFSGLLTMNEKTSETRRQLTNNRLKHEVHFTDKDDWILSNHDNDKIDHKRVCPRTNTSVDSNIQWQRKKRFNYDTEIRDNPFEDSGKDKGVFKHNQNKPSSNMPRNINLEGKNESLQLENVIDNLNGTKKKIDMYEVGDPNIWFRTQIQLLEKLSTPGGKTIWNDLTKQESVRIGSLCPDWTNQDVYIRYRCAERVPKEDFTLPSSGICLLLPQNGQSNDGFSSVNMGEFIIVPFEDILLLEENGASKRSHGNASINGLPGSEENPRRILVRLSRALFGRNEDNFKVINKGSGKYLTIPYKSPHHAQIDLEAKADENQLVYVGLSGRLTTAVSENTRRSRAMLTVQVTNTGLAAARFRPKIRDCNPELLRLNEDEIAVALKPILIPPLHTHKFSLEIPSDISNDITHCSVALLNDGDESVAVRDVRIKRGDRCFCVWHCQCVCLNEDPKLLCQEMPEHQQIAAGLSPRDRPRQVRAACCPDVVTINLLVIVFGVLLLLLVLGFLKACLGLFLRCVGAWGIDSLLQTPRRLDCYYERTLRSRPVTYDEDGWPVHPDTMKRTVRLISPPMEFMLNVIFFITMPCVVLWNSLKNVIVRCQNKEKKGDLELRTKKRCCDMQGKDVKETRWRWRYHRRYLSKWMSPQAEQLSTDIWRNGLTPQGFYPPECMLPLLREDRFQGNKMHTTCSPAVDSEQDDTEYVVMQIQNSRETLAKDLQRIKPTSIVTD